MAAGEGRGTGYGIGDRTSPRTAPSRQPNLTDPCTVATPSRQPTLPRPDRRQDDPGRTGRWRSSHRRFRACVRALFR